MTAAIFLSGCAGVENKEGKFYDFLVKPMEWLLHFFSGQFGGSYGLAIVVITVLIRLILMPLMLKNYKKQQEMKIKMDALRPEMEDIQKKLKEAKEAGNKDEQTKLQQEMMGLYSKHGVNPLNMGCLPLIIQMPIIMGLYFAILYSPEVKETKFLWFNLRESRYDYDANRGCCLFRSSTRFTLDNAGSAKTTDENVHLLITNHDYVYFFQSSGCTSTLLGSRGNTTYFPNLPRTEIIL